MKALIFIVLGIIYIGINSAFEFPWWVYAIIFGVTAASYWLEIREKVEIILVIFNICLCLALYLHFPVWIKLIVFCTIPVLYFLNGQELRKTLNITSIVCLGLSTLYWGYFLLALELEFNLAFNHIYKQIVLEMVELFRDLIAFSCLYVLIPKAYKAYYKLLYTEVKEKPPIRIKYPQTFWPAIYADLNGDLTNILSDLETALENLHKQKYAAEHKLKKLQATSPLPKYDGNKNDRSYVFMSNRVNEINAEAERKKMNYIDLIAKIDNAIRMGNERLNEVRLKAPKHRGFSNPKDFGTIDGLSSSPFYDTE